MRPVLLTLCATALSAVLGTSALAVDFPLAGSKITLKDSSPSKRRVAFQGRYAGDLGDMNPNFDGTTLRIYGGTGEGDSGLIHLDRNWKALPKGKGFRYQDKTQSARGIRSILLRKGKRGGRLKIVGGSAKWTYELTAPQSVVTVNLRIGDAKLCAQFTNPKNGKKRLNAGAPKALQACPCEKYDSTWEAIQEGIFQRHGCTDATCHGSAAGAAASGGLDLRPEVAFENLVNVFSELGQMDRVEPGSPTNDSFLYRKLAAKTKGLTGVPGTPMPQGLPAISEEELEALRLWIQYSGQKEGTVAGTEDLLLDSCLPSAKPPHLAPPDPPAPGTGVQYYAHPWTIQPHGEDEGCYATFYDVSAQVPDEFKVDCPAFWGGTPKGCYFFNKTELTQEPNSHHSIIHIYRGKYTDSVGHFCSNTKDADGLPIACDPGKPGVAAPDGADCPAGSSCTNGFEFRCGATEDGAICDPRVPGVCGPDLKCLGVFETSLACLTFGPPDFTDIQSAISGTGGANAPQVGGSQQPFARTAFPGGVYGIYPLRATWVWNSHAFNTTDEPTYNQQWYNIYFAPLADRTFPIRGVFDAADIFVQDVPPFQEREYCRTITFGIGTRLFELSSHTHARGRLFRGWGPGIAPRCRSTMANPGACVAEPTSPVFTTTQYNDPTQLRFATPVALDSPDPAARTFKFCSIYDNGFTDPAHVKRNSMSPIPPTFGTLAPGGPCLVPGIGGFSRDLGIACMDGPRKGLSCEGDAPGFQADDRKCDSPGQQDGVCDACPLRGGVTTQDEMFIPLGSYYCDPSVPGNTCDFGMCNGGAKWGQACTGTPGECGPGARCEAYIN